MRVPCDVEEVELDPEGEFERQAVPGLCLTCTRCDHQVEVYGTSPRSVRKGLVLLREECPLNEDNYYVASDGEDRD